MGGMTAQVLDEGAQHHGIDASEKSKGMSIYFASTVDDSSDAAAERYAVSSSISARHWQSLSVKVDVDNGEERNVTSARAVVRILTHKDVILVLAVFAAVGAAVSVKVKYASG